jgi:hypothetical protein
LSEEGAGEVRLGVHIRFGASSREAVCALRLWDCTGSASDLELGSAPEAVSKSETVSSICIVAGRCVEGGGDGVAAWLDRDWAAATSCC